MRYRLPEALGGGEFDEYRKVDGGTEAPVGTVAFLVNGCIVAVARALLTEVKPLMAEPPDTSVVEVTRKDKLSPFVAQRDSAHEGRVWFTTAGSKPKSWAEILEVAESITLLVPDPFAEPVELPWEHESANGAVTEVAVFAGLPSDDREAVGEKIASVGDFSVAFYTPAAARAKARALWAAADAAERYLLEGGAS